MKRIAFAVGLVSLAVLAGCSSMSESTLGDSSTSPGRGPANAGEASGDPSGGSSSGSGEAASGSSTAPGSQKQAGQLTAGVWDDNLNYEFFGKYLMDSSSLTGIPKYSLEERKSAHDTFLQRVPASELDIAFLFDTTGSMGDELNYLQTEVDSIAQRIKDKFPSTTPRFALVVYKDKGDAYITRKFDFTDLAGFRTALNNQSAGGGGDYPEAVAEGLSETVALSWRPDAVSRLTFWIADAPHHNGQELTVKQSIDAALQKGIHIYPVAASGTDPRAEYTMRTAAQITGGRYIFLTDDSGIGNAHAEPHIPCYHVTRFDSAIVRMVESEMTGGRVAPAAEEILRTVGSPSPDGKCTLQSKEEVTLY